MLVYYYKRKTQLDSLLLDDIIVRVCAGHSSVSSAEVKNEWSETYTSPVCLQGVYRNSFALFTSYFYSRK